MLIGERKIFHVFVCSNKRFVGRVDPLLEIYFYTCVVRNMLFDYMSLACFVVFPAS